MAMGKVYLAGQLIGKADHAIVLEAMRHMEGEFHASRVVDSTFELYVDMKAIQSRGGEFLARHLTPLRESDAR